MYPSKLSLIGMHGISLGIIGKLLKIIIGKNLGHRTIDSMYG